MGFGGAAAFELADEFWGEAKIGGDHVLGNTLDELGEAASESEIALFTGVGEEIEAVLLGGGEGTLDDETEIAVDLGQAVAERRDVVAVEDGEGRGFNGLDIKTGGLAPVEALKVGHPPVLDGKLGDLFHAVLADKVHADTTFQDKVIGRADLPLTEEVFLFPDGFVTQKGGQDGGFLLVERHIFADVRKERMEAIRGQTERFLRCPRQPFFRFPT